ncbi:thiol reductant ABC exporter subunit CydC [Gemella sp. GH3]|uniref:thiol reductant ABC exporter subunit CydC n=1 Tax=unclassified Gemella TaxID=2624949 RepID=UPI0015D0B34B|nr:MULTISPECIES: thiol reductant ABC exporter subunit CydC [unclassified Gemella]MBF0713238.1 thiol reductant ABC exporter subunit CydC [Gemella sp. GH3.1]NYS50190.1 thiol reductant ABC exporter subunit CydC [Gemella sp. GH3]
MKQNSLILKDIKRNKSQMALIIILGLLSAMSGAALMYVSGFLISKSSLKIGNILMLQVPTVLTRTFSLSQSVFSYIQRLVSHDLVLKIIEKMRSKVYIILEPMALRLKRSYKSGDLLGLISEDIEHLQNVYLKSIFPSVISLLLYVIFITVMFGYDVSYALLATLFGLFIIFIIPFMSLIVTKNNLTVMKNAKYELYKDFTNAIFGISDLVSASKEKEFIKGYKEKEDVLLKKEHKTKIFIHLREVLVQILAAAVALLMIYSCKNMIINNTIENVYIASFCMVTLSVLSVVVMTGDAISQIPAYQVSIDRVKNFYSEEKNITDNNLKKEESDHIIEVNNVSFSYDDRTPVLKDLNLSIKSGEKVAILGRSGVGKSTLIKLLTGTYTDYQGKISIMGYEPNEKLLGSKISLLNQKPYLFDMSIKENIELAVLDDNYDESNIKDSLEKVQIKNLIEKLPNKLDTSVYESGGRFSGGERQRLAFARTLIQNNELLLLDEPTVGLDPKTEKDLLKTIFENSKDKTILWITHHMNSIEDMDKIIFIKDGKVEMEGNHEELYRTNSKYKKLYDLDMGY